MEYRLTQEIAVRLAEASPITGGLIFGLAGGGATRGQKPHPRGRGKSAP